MNADAFHATRSGGKPVELRANSQWIRSRLFKTGTGARRHYDFIEYYLGPAPSYQYDNFRVRWVGFYYHYGNITIGPYATKPTKVYSFNDCWVISNGERVPHYDANYLNNA
jgi:hypothetical protein